MAKYSPYIISGPEEDYDIPHESIGKILFDRLRKRSPDEIISVDAFTGDVLTCGKLLESSIKLTAVLSNFGIKKGDVIALISENTISYTIPLLTTLYMGVIIQPLNPAYSIGEVKHTLVVSKAKLIICSKSALQPALEVKKELDFVETVLLIGPQSEDVTKNIDELLKMTVMDIENFTPNKLDDSEHGAFILLSSGTTGLPKGVLLTHKNIRSGIGYTLFPSCANVVSGDVTIQILPYYHIFGLIVHISAIAASMKSILMHNFAPDLFLKCIQEHKVTKLFAVPPILLFLVKSPLVEKYDVSSITDFIVGGAPAGKELETEAKIRFRNARIRQAYGLTETTAACTYTSPVSIKTGSVGVLVPGITCKVWDPERKEIVGPCKAGELCFKGSTIMKGYVGNTEATQECIDEDGFYHTGDVGYYDDDKFFFVIERMKDLIKYKGFQVSPAELEALIVTHPGVKECGVIGIPDERAGQLPFAFVVRQTGANITEQEIIHFVEGRISINKRLYGGVKLVNEIPKNATGKILRKKLRELYQNML